MLRCRAGETEFGHPGRHLVVRKAQPPVRALPTKVLAQVRRQVDDDEPAARRQHPHGLGQHRARVVGEMQHLVEDGGGERGVGQRQAVHVAVPHLAVPGLATVEVGPRHAQHVVAAVDAEAEADRARQDLQDAPGAGADVEQVGGPQPGKETLERLLDPRTVDGEVALAVPAPRPAVEPALGGAPPRLAHALEALAVQGQHLVVVRQEAAQGAGETGPGTGLGPPVEHPAALPEALEQPGLGQDPQVARDARLALPQDLDELAHRPLALRADRQQPQPRRVAGGTDAVEQRVKRAGHVALPSSLSDAACSRVDMLISLYANVNGFVRGRPTLRPRPSADAGGAVTRRRLHGPHGVP